MKKNLRNPVALLFILVSFLGQACSGNQTVNVKESNETIVIDLEGNLGKGNIVDLSSVVSDIEYIPLETSDSSLVGDSKKIYFENGRIFFVSGQINQTNKMLQVYDSLGRHLFCFDRLGRGPQEYNSVYHMSILPDGKIEINTRIDVMLYNGDGNFFRKFPLPKDRRFSVSEVLKMNDDTYAGIIYYYFAGNPEYCAVIFTPGDSSAQYMMPIPAFQQKDPFSTNLISSISIEGEPETDKNIKLIGARVMLFRNKNFARFVFPYNDTIFSLTPDMKLEKPFVIKYGKTRSPGGEDSESQWQKYVVLRSTPFENERFLFLTFNLNDHAHQPYEKEIVLSKGRVHRYTLTDCHSLLDKKTGHFTLLNQQEKGMPGMREDILGGPPFWPLYVSSKGELVAFCQPEVLISWAENHKVSPGLKRIIEKLDENDNPVVVLAKLKR